MDIAVGGSRLDPAQAGRAALPNPNTTHTVSQGEIGFIIDRE